MPKAVHAIETVRFVYGQVAGETDRSWLVKCSHFFAAPVRDEAVASAEEQLGLVIPAQYKALLKVTDGARLFCIRTPWLDSDFPEKCRTFGIAYSAVKSSYELIENWFKFLGGYTVTTANSESAANSIIWPFAMLMTAITKLCWLDRIVTGVFSFCSMSCFTGHIAMLIASSTIPLRNRLTCGSI